MSKLDHMRHHPELARAVEIIDYELRAKPGVEYDNPDKIFFMEVARRASMHRLLQHRVQLGDKDAEIMMFASMASNLEIGDDNASNN